MIVEVGAIHIETDRCAVGITPENLCRLPAEYLEAIEAAAAYLVNPHTPLARDLIGGVLTDSSKQFGKRKPKKAA